MNPSRFLSFFTRPFALALSASVLLWLAYPPVAAGPLAWVATIPWMWIANARHRGPGNAYSHLYLAGLIHWLLMTQWVRLPHWSTGFGWIVLAAYLAAYVPLFIGLTRVGVHRLGISIVWVAPCIWTGLEVFRSFFATGFPLALLGHTQADWNKMIQIADLAGGYLVGTVIVWVGACVVEVVSRWSQTRQFCRWPVLAALAALLSCWGYGHWRVSSNASLDTGPQPVRIGLVQGSIDTMFGAEAVGPGKIFSDYLRLSQELVTRHGGLDAVVWPESMFPPKLFLEQETLAGGHRAELAAAPRDRIAEQRHYFAEGTALLARVLRVPAIVGTTAVHWRGSQYQHFNTAVLVDDQGQVQGRYDKMHPVMFGEYIPFGRWMPWLYALTPLSSGLTPGTRPTVFEVDGLRLAPAICFENTVPHLIRRQVAQLAADGTPPDALVTLTNDGWFWGSSLLDLHLTCGVFRAVETRRPVLIAANTGISAWIDHLGRIRAKGPRRREAVLVAELRKRPAAADSLYLGLGDWFGFACVAACGLAAIVGIRGTAIRSPTTRKN